ncbi:MAG TPA: R3H domain-containing nucleic acid-binding protein [Actinomycetota bacterium]|nr:R3H domain-containing nucleic acid-binding protein [Actinomycetota bacterium]
MTEEREESYADAELEQPLEGDPPAESGAEEELEPATPEDVASTAEEFVSGLLKSLELEGEVSSSVEGDTATVEVSGEALGGLIGRRGQTLDALQEITRTAVQRRLRGRVRVLVDVEGYRARRRASLAEYARSIAERAKERGTEIELEPMTAYERKVVHDAVAEIDGATSFSEGVEPNRKVVVRGE